jgi:hypothetical protein
MAPLLLSFICPSCSIVGLILTSLVVSKNIKDCKQLDNKIDKIED